jgi:condensin complex subunit 2
MTDSLLGDDEPSAVLAPLDVNAPRTKTRFLVDSEDEDEDSEDDDDDDNAVRGKLSLDGVSSEEEEEDDDYENATPVRMRPPRPVGGRKSILPMNNTTNAAAASSKAGVTASAKRRRRRSSARFLRLTNRFDNDADDVDGEDGEGGTTLFADDSESQSQSQNNTQINSQANLGELYKKAIRMNAENRINASNSWNLRLIENIDQFLMEDDDEDDGGDTGGGAPSKSKSHDTSQDEPQESTTEQVAMKNADSLMTSTLPQHRRVNFTKASCTLDASVKIYSYRVDDVHLTSYKVLANLNRTDNDNSGEKSSKKKQADKNADGVIDDNDDAETTRNTVRNRNNGNTIEANLGTLLVCLHVILTFVPLVRT